MGLASLDRIGCGVQFLDLRHGDNGSVQDNVGLLGLSGVILSAFASDNTDGDEPMEPYATQRRIGMVSAAACFQKRRLFSVLNRHEVMTSEIF